MKMGNDGRAFFDLSCVCDPKVFVIHCTVSLFAFWVFLFLIQ